MRKIFNMKINNDIFELYKKVQNNDKKAESQLISLHKKKYPKHDIHKSNEHLVSWKSSRGKKEFFHMLYLHLT